MIKKREKNRTILSLTSKEVEELEFMVFYADKYWQDYPTDMDNTAEIKENKKFVAALRKWCKAFGFQSCASLFSTRYC